MFISLASQQYTLAVIRPNAHADAKTIEIVEKVNTIYSPMSPFITNL